MYITKIFKVPLGEIELGFVPYESAIRVKLIQATLLSFGDDAPELRDILLTDDHRLPSFSHEHWRDFDQLVEIAIKKVEWPALERQLYQQAAQELEADINSLERELDGLTFEYNKRLEMRKEIQADAEKGFYQKAIRAAQKLIYR